MSTLNGIGTRFNAVSRPDQEGRVKATLWVTFFYLPILPLWKAEILRKVRLPLKEFQYQIIQKIPIDLKEVFTTYLFGWILIPALLLFPFVFLIPEVMELFNIPSPQPRNLIRGDSLNWHDWLFIFSIIYLIIVLVRLYAWNIKRGLPDHYEDILKREG